MRNAEGKEVRPWVSEALRGKGGPQSRAWKGEGITYCAKHYWLIKNYGRATRCEDCGLSEVPKGKKRYFDWANISGEYKREREDYKQLCRPCHRIFDRKEVCRNGHSYADVGFYTRKEGWRVCKECHKSRMKEYVAKNNSLSR